MEGEVGLVTEEEEEARAAMLPLLLLREWERLSTAEPHCEQNLGALPRSWEPHWLQKRAMAREGLLTVVFVFVLCVCVSAPLGWGCVLCVCGWGCCPLPLPLPAPRRTAEGPGMPGGGEGKPALEGGGLMYGAAPETFTGGGRAWCG
jgi:hypothetical protein